MLRSLPLLLAAAASAAAWPSRDASCDGASVRLTLNPGGGSQWALPSSVGRPLARAPSPPLTLRVAAPVDGCTAPGDDAPYRNDTLVLVTRGDCSFAQKARAAAGAAVVAVVARDRHCFGAGAANDTGSLTPLITVNGATGARLLAASAVAGATVTVADLAAGPPRLDPAAGVIGLLATTVVACGALLAGRDEVAGGEEGRTLLAPSDGDATPRSPRGGASFSLDTPAAAAGLVGGAASLLVAAALAPRLAFWALTALFLVASFESVSAAAAAAAALAGSPPATASHAGVAVAAAAVAGWAAVGPRVGWPLHDAMAATLLASLLRGLRLPSLRVGAALLTLAAANDVWWVFVQPRVTGGASAMVAVATATPALVLLAPGWLAGPRAPFMILGFGDVAVPGLAVAFAARWDAASAAAARGGGAAFPLTAAAGVVGYAVGLALTFAALVAGVGGGAGQPALLYLCPCVLAAVAAAAAARGRLGAAWAGLDAREGGEEEDEGV